MTADLIPWERTFMRSLPKRDHVPKSARGISGSLANDLACISALHPVA